MSGQTVTGSQAEVKDARGRRPGNRPRGEREGDPPTACLLTEASLPTLAEALVVAVGAERIRVAVEADVDRRILLRVVRDLGDLDHLVCPDGRVVGIEEDVLERGPGQTGRALDPRRTGWALHTGDALLARGTLRPCRAHRARGTGNTADALSAGRAGGTVELLTAAHHEQHEHSKEQSTFHRPYLPLMVNST